MWWDLVKTNLREQFGHETVAVVAGKNLADITSTDYDSFSREDKVNYHRSMGVLLNRLLKLERKKRDTDVELEEELRLEARFHTRQLARAGRQGRQGIGEGSSPELRGGQTFFDIDAENAAGMQSLRPTKMSEYEARLDWTEEEYNSKTQQEKKNYHEAMSKKLRNPQGKVVGQEPKQGYVDLQGNTLNVDVHGPIDKDKGDWHSAMAQRMNKDKNYEAPFNQEGEDTFVRKPPSHKGKGAVTGGHRDEEGNITDEGREWRRNYMREWRKKKREEGPEYQQRQTETLRDWRHKTGKRVKGRKPWAVKRPKDEEE
jgi:hypothetical protein